MAILLNLVKSNELAPRRVSHVHGYSVDRDEYCSTFYRGLCSTVEMAGSNFRTTMMAALSPTICN